MASGLRRFEIAAYNAQQVDGSSALILQADQRVSFSSEHLPQQKQLNQKTWDLFLRTLTQTIGLAKYQWICNRYCFDAQSMQKQGKPLLPEHIKLFTIGAGQIFTSDIKRLYPPGRKIKQLTRLELQEKMRQAQPFQNTLSTRLNPVFIGGTPSQSHAWIFYHPLLMDEEKLMLFSDVQSMSVPAFLERFCKAIVNRELFEKQLIPAVGSDGRADFYRVYKKISTGHGLVAYALKPATSDSTLKPLLIFRPTQIAISHEDMFQSIFNGLEPLIAKSGYVAAKPLFERLIKDSAFLPPGKKMDIAGYSLGGAHAQRFLADFHPFVSSAYFYSNPSIDRQTAERFAAETLSSRRDDLLNLYIFRIRGDICHYVGGEKHIGCNAKANIELYEVDHENAKITVMSAHAFKIFDSVKVNYRMQCIKDPHLLFAHLDNSRRGEEVIWYERMRQVWGRIVYVYLYFVYLLLIGCSKVLGVNLLRSSKNRR